MNRVIKSCPVIGVVTPYGKSFEQWKSDIGFKTYGEDAKFIQIRRMEDVIGRKYSAIEKGYKYYEIDSGIYDAAVLRVRLMGIHDPATIYTHTTEKTK